MPPGNPHCLVPKGKGTPWKDKICGSDHPCRWAHGLGILHYLCSEGKGQAMPVLGSLWPQQGHLLRSSQDANCGGSCSWVCALLLLHQVGCLPWILVNHSQPGVQPAYKIQQFFQKILLPATSLWSHLFPRHFPEEDGPNPGRVPRMHQNCRWHHCPQLHQGGPWCLPAKSHADCLQICLVFNQKKSHVKAQAVNFFGCLYNADGVHPDPGKVDTVHALPAPRNITKLQEFLGLVTYFSPFIPGLSTLSVPLHELLKKDTDFTWNCTFNVAFQQVKEAVISDTTLRYFNPLLAMTIQVNASQVGLGAVLLWNDKPMAFASKAFTKTKCQYANIERERC